eukprot:TRINITY_DN67336_c0_g1_i1.p1 TRINITY_DN67336_c0_g1~~TRINITY_DN67336_c0_g1_i1.p1  ORF type:complete len:186 (-),score=28.40 TRINITY_DN67336_c0_g1_i1:145-666(-)
MGSLPSVSITSSVKFALPWSISFGHRLTCAYFALLILLLWYKTIVFVYPLYAILEESAMLLCFLALQLSRLGLGAHGHRTDSVLLLAAFVWLALPAAFVVNYYLNLQVYVLRLDVFACAVLLAALAIEALLGLLRGALCADSLAERGVLAAGAGTFLVMAIFAPSYYSSLPSI